MLWHSDLRNHREETFWEKRRNSLENITSERGIELRMNRSIQVEGAFGLLKNDFGFRRFLTRGKRNIRIELFFLALGFNCDIHNGQCIILDPEPHIPAAEGQTVDPFRV